MVILVYGGVLTVFCFVLEVDSHHTFPTYTAVRRNRLVFKQQVETFAGCPNQAICH